MIRVFLVALILSPAFLWAQDPVKRDEHQMHGLHNDPKAYIGSLEDPKRDAYQKPQGTLIFAVSIFSPVRAQVIARLVLRCETTKRANF
jgi:hypothetical protein